MAKTAFVKMKRSTPNPLDNLTEIEVHPDAVASHVAAGWYVAPAQAEPAEEAEEEKEKKPAAVKK